MSRVFERGEGAAAATKPVLSADPSPLPRGLREGVDAPRRPGEGPRGGVSERKPVATQPSPSLHPPTTPANRWRGRCCHAHRRTPQGCTCAAQRLYWAFGSLTDAHGRAVGLKWGAVAPAFFVAFS